jgi:hypothetical protein
MKKVIRLTESELTRLIKRVVNEQMEGGSDPVRKDPGGSDSDYWGKIIKPKLIANGWTERVDPNIFKDDGFQVCPYKCCTYMYKGNHNTGPIIFLDCGDNPTAEPWQLTVYTKGNQNIRTFGTGDEAAKKAVAYALTLK